MTDSKLFSVTDWSSYKIVRATNANTAVQMVHKRKSYKVIPREELTEFTVTHIMCCEYSGETKQRLSKCVSDVDRILLMDMSLETSHYQIR